ncbi:MAG: preQ(1) synthase [Deltaproteobacteria bacterium]|nr:preQ(1) synthase [Deltaproteobacteria bacterium]
MDVTDTSYAEGRILEFDGPEKIAVHLLKTFPYSGPRQKILYETREFSAVCPFSGLPDYACFSLEYIPAEHIVELKSLKYYIVSYRNVGIFQEPATARLYQDLHSLLAPQWLKVKTVYNVRGGIDATCEVDSAQQ